MKPTGGQVAWLAWGAVMLGVAFVGADVTKNDFHSFYLSGLSLRTGEAYVIIDRPDLNPPFFAWLMVPFTWLPVQTAFAVWTGLGAAALVASLRIISRHSVLSPWVYGTVGATVPCQIVWQEGQLTWFLLYFVTKAWADQSPGRAGLWLMPVVLLKPPLALMVMCLPWRIVVTTGVASLAALGLLVAISGTEPWLMWLGKSSIVQWLDWPANASLWGVAARLQSGTVWGTSMVELSSSALLIIPAIIMIAVMSLRARDDWKWIAGVLFATLASPLGWVYYLPAALGPLVRVWHPAFNIPLAVLSIPMPLLAIVASRTAVGAVVVGSVYGFAVLGAWLVSVNRSVNHAAQIPAVSSGLSPLKASAKTSIPA